MRTVTFSDPRIREMLMSDFVCVWKNIRPEVRFRKGINRERRPEMLLGCTRTETGADNICAFVARADGRIVSVVQGFQDPAVFTGELEFAVRLKSEKSVPDLREAYRKRADENRRNGASGNRMGGLLLPHREKAPWVRRSNSNHSG